MDIYDEIKQEREYQDSKWGTTFDDANTINDWGTYINIYLAKATDMGVKNDPNAQRKAILKVATLAVAAIQTLDRNGTFAPRHYE